MSGCPSAASNNTFGILFSTIFAVFFSVRLYIGLLILLSKGDLGNWPSSYLNLALVFLAKLDLGRSSKGDLGSLSFSFLDLA